MWCPQKWCPPDVVSPEITEVEALAIQRRHKVRPYAPSKKREAAIKSASLVQGSACFSFSGATSTANGFTNDSHGKGSAQPSSDMNSTASADTRVNQGNQATAHISNPVNTTDPVPQVTIPGLTLNAPSPDPQTTIPGLTPTAPPPAAQHKSTGANSIFSQAFGYSTHGDRNPDGYRFKHTAPTSQSHTPTSNSSARHPPRNDSRSVSPPFSTQPIVQQMAPPTRQPRTQDGPVNTASPTFTNSQGLSGYASTATNGPDPTMSSGQS